MPLRAEGRPARRRRRPAVEVLDGRILPSLGVQYALGVGATGQSADIRANAVAVDAAGDAYVTGSLVGSADFAAGRGAAATLANTGGRDLYVAKYSPSGALVWAEAMPGAGSHAVGQGQGIAVDSSGNVLLTGSFSGTIGLGPGPGPGATALSSGASAFDGFIAKLDGSGRVLWARDIGATAYSVDAGQAIAADSAGNVYATGLFTDRAVFGGTVLTTSAQDDAFATKLDPDGNFLWAVSTRGSSYPAATQGSGIAVDASGGVAIAGSFAATVNFRPGPGPGVANLTAAGSKDAFLWKLNADGSFAWAEAFGGGDVDQAHALAADASGNLVVTGTFSGRVEFGATALDSGGTEGAFVLKAGPAGKVLWARGYAGPAGPAVGRGIALDAAGDVIAGGDFSGTVDFASGTGSAPLAGAGSTNVFALELDAAGGFLAARSMSAPGANYGFGLAAGPSGAVSIVGTYSGPATFGGATLPQLGNASIFVAGLTLGSASLPSPGLPVLEAASDTGVSQTDGITASISPVFDVNGATAVDSVDLIRDGRVVATRNGPGAITDPGPVPAGLHAYTARRRDAQGTASSPGPPLTVTFLIIPPPAPAAPALLTADDSGAAGDGITNVRRPRLAGRAAANGRVELLDGSGAVLGRTTAAADGSYTVTPAADLADGPHALSVRALDIAGNVGASGPAIALTIDTLPPATPAAPALMAADDSGVAGDGITNVRQPRLVGTAESGSTVQLLAPSGAILARVAAGPDGSYSARLPDALADGVYYYRVRSLDAAGNSGLAGPTLALTIDATSPPAPPQPALFVVDDTGVLGDGITSIRRPRIVGTAAPGARIMLLDPAGLVLGSARAGSDGLYTVTTAVDLAEGTHPLRVGAVDVAGNVGLPSLPLPLIVDVTPPAAPSGLALLPADDSGTLGDGITAVTSPRLAGGTEPGSTVQLLDAADAVLGSALAGTDGSFTVRVSGLLADGTYAFRARAVDAAGNLGPAGPAMTLTIVGTPPPTPAIPTLLATDDSGTVGDGITQIRRPRVIGRVAPALTVQLVDAGGLVLGTTTAGVDGSYALAPTSDLADGPHALRARALDGAGNVGLSSGILTLTIDTSAPSAPAAPALLMADDSGAVGDGVTNVNRPRLVGVTEPNAFVLLTTAGGAFLNWAVAGADGSYTIRPGAPLGGGVYSLSVHAIDAAGNAGAAGPALRLTVLTAPPAAPAAPALLSADDSGAVGDGITNVNLPRLAGVVEPNAFVLLTTASGAFLNWTVAGADGSYTIRPGAPLGDGVYSLSVHAIDAAGNAGAVGPALRLTVLTAPPAAPAAPALLMADDSGAVGDGVTNVNRPRLVGVTEPNAFVLLTTAGGAFVNWTVAGADGSYTIRPGSPLGDGVYPLSVHAIDAAGNVGLPGPALTLTIAAIPPAPPLAPSLLPGDMIGVVRQSNSTTLRQPHLVGTVPPGVVVQLLDSTGAVIATTLGAANGRYVVQFPRPLPLGVRSWRVRVLDVAGNLSAPSAGFALNIGSR